MEEFIFSFQKWGIPQGTSMRWVGDKEVKITCFPYTTLKLNLLYFQFEPQPLQINDYWMINLAIFSNFVPFDSSWFLLFLHPFLPLFSYGPSLCSFWLSRPPPPTSVYWQNVIPCCIRADAYSLQWYASILRTSHQKTMIMEPVFFLDYHKICQCTAEHKGRCLGVWSWPCLL